MEALKLENAHLNERQLKEMAVKLAKDIWGAKFNLPIIISKRMTNTLGCFKHSTTSNGQRNPIKIQISWYLVNGNYTYETIESVMKHELCHWYLFITNQPYRDVDPTFKREVVRIGSHLTHTIIKSGDLYIGVCSCCGETIVESRTAEKAIKQCNKYISKCHKAEIIYKGLKTIEDNNSTHIIRQTNVTPETKQEQPKVNNTQSEIKKAADIPVINKNIKIESIIKSGPKGITNFQMIPAIKLVIDENSKEKLTLLKNTYSEVFQSSLKYIGKKYLDKLNKLI